MGKCGFKMCYQKILRYHYGTHFIHYQLKVDNFNEKELRQHELYRNLFSK